jgi:hypothetical protein
MNIDQVTLKIGEHIQKIDGTKKRFFVTILNCLQDPDFAALLNGDERRMLEQLNDNLGGSRDIAWMEQHQPQQIDFLRSLYFKCLAYNNDKRKSISAFETKVYELRKNVEAAQKDVEHIGATAKLLSGATILAEYAKDFGKQAGQHGDKASTWIKWLIASIVALVVLISVLIFLNITEFPPLREVFAEDLRQSGELTVLVLAIKAALVFAYLQIPYFIKRNYFAEKHLEQACIHRRDVLQALHAVYNALDDKSERDKIISTGAAIAFSEAESGYITRREGAGGADDGVSALISRIWK